MKVIRDFDEFYKRVKPLRFDDFDGLDIVPSTEFGDFFKNRLSDLLLFCKNNQQYHIISNLSLGVMLNKPSNEAHHYELGQGESDPELMYIEKINWKGYEYLKISKFNRDQL